LLADYLQATTLVLRGNDLPDPKTEHVIALAPPFATEELLTRVRDLIEASCPAQAGYLSAE